MGVVNRRLPHLGTQVDRRGLFKSAIAGVPVSGGWPTAEGAPNPLADPRTRLAHLLRRAGFGASQAELDRFEAMGYQVAVEWLLNFNNVPDYAEERLTQLEFDFTRNDDLKRWWFVRMRYTTRPLQEKLTLFLHGLLTSGLSKAPLPMMKLQNELFRAYGMGTYRHLLIAISRDPAMLLWLDGNNSRKQHPNENYAREVMELFTIGIGHYTEDDVQEAARAFTGWRVVKEANATTYNPRTHDPDIKTFMGRTGRFGDEDIIDIILEQRATAEFLARRMWSYFAYSNPEPAVLAPLADTLRNSGYDIAAALRHIFLSDGFSSPRAYRSIVKSPVDYVIGTLRALEIETDGKSLPYLTRLMGQDIFDPPNVAGWPGGPTWLNSALWLQRANFANSIATRRKGDPGTFFNITQLLSSERLTNLEGFQSHMTGVLLDGQLDADSVSTLANYRSATPSAIRPGTLWSRKGSGLLYLLLASPEYQLL